jgi:hypothetical protein
MTCISSLRISFLVQEQLSAGFRIVVEPVAEIVFVNVGVIEMELTLIDLGKGIPNLTAPGAQRFHFGPFEDDTRFVGLQNEVIRRALELVMMSATKTEPEGV